MWRERIIEAKKANNITTKMMSERVRLPDTTITRILNRKTPNPRIDTVLDLGASVGLLPRELFSDTTAVLSDKTLALLQEELNTANATLDALRAEYTALSEEATDLKVKLVSLQAENDMLKIKLEHKDEIIDLHNYYKTVISGMSK